MTVRSEGDPSTCPRCGGAFLCGRNAVEPCACGTLILSAELTRQLLQQYRNCLCLDCLRQLAVTETEAEAQAEMAADKSAGPGIPR